MRNKVYIRPVKSGSGAFVVCDAETNQRWANETFKDEDEAKQFCKDNKLTIFERKVIESKIKTTEVDVEDGGQAMIATITEPTDTDNGMFIRIQSWDEQLEHKEFKKFVGKKVRITIETID